MQRRVRLGGGNDVAFGTPEGLLRAARNTIPSSSRGSSTCHGDDSPFVRARSGPLRSPQVPSDSLKAFRSRAPGGRGIEHRAARIDEPADALMGDLQGALAGLEGLRQRCLSQLLSGLQVCQGHLPGRGVDDRVQDVVVDRGRGRQGPVRGRPCQRGLGVPPAGRMSTASSERTTVYPPVAQTFGREATVPVGIGSAGSISAPVLRSTICLAATAE